MSENKRCIFHIPNYIDVNRKSASNIRPFKMIDAFEENGYIVDVVMGYANQRKKQINKIKHNIKNGVKYDFLYSESSTMPTLLTEQHHLPLHPRLDFSFMKYCKKHGIKIGLFYRDIYWLFPIYKKEVSFLKRALAIPCYKYDLYQYRRLLNVFYVPSKLFKEYLPQTTQINTNYEIKLLPPGCDIKEVKKSKIKKEESRSFTIFYVGGISKDIYNFEILFKVVSKLKNRKLIVCCREKEWDTVKEEYNQYLSDNIQIVHVSGEELEKYYAQADVTSLIFENHEYRKIAMPMKAFEYLAHNKPIIAIKGTSMAEFIEENNIGWTIEYDEVQIEKLLCFLRDNPKELERVINNQKKIIPNNTWDARARAVINDLKV